MLQRVLFCLVVMVAGAKSYAADAISVDSTGTTLCASSCASSTVNPQKNTNYTLRLYDTRTRATTNVQAIIFQNVDTEHHARIEVADNGGSGNAAATMLFKVNSAVEGTNPGARMIIRHDGTVGINTESPSSAFKLHVVGNALASGGTFQDSDYRLKQNITPLSNSLDRILKLKPARYSFTASPAREEEGFLAHELQQVIPAAVMGQKDEMDKNGQILPQAVNYSAVIPALAGAIQELKTALDKSHAENEALSKSNDDLFKSIQDLTRRLGALEAAQKPAVPLAPVQPVQSTIEQPATQQ